METDLICFEGKTEDMKMEKKSTSPAKPANSSEPGSKTAMPSQEQIDQLTKELEESRIIIKNLKNSNKLYQSVIDHLPHFYIFWKDLKSTLLGGNKRFIAKAGLHSKEEILGKTDHDLSWSDQAEAFYNIDQMGMKQNLAEYTVDEPQVPVDGKEIRLSTTKVAVNNDEGEVIGLVGISKDVTEKRKSDQLLRDSES
ncbi:MAG: PAS domain-containing protein [Proteobacteria bacterium]|nr:PAS domain-containing protein [Pseudomonadota bacterium]